LPSGPWAEIYFARSTVGLAITMADGKWAKLNASFARMLGYSVEELQGAPLAAYTHPDDIAATEEFMRTLLAGKADTLTLEKRYVHRDGHAVWAELSSCVLRDKSGVPLYFISSVVDLSQRRQAAEALRRGEYFFRESQRAGFIGSFRIDFTTGVWESSEVLDQILGIDRACAKTVESWFDLVHPDDRDGLRISLTGEVILQDLPVDREYRVVRRSDGETRWVDGRGTVTHDAAGRPLSMIGTLQDITERKRDELALRARDERHQAILGTAMDGFWKVLASFHIHSFPELSRVELRAVA
jgi:PAS domain S-box-containing protein